MDQPSHPGISRRALLRGVGGVAALAASTALAGCGSASSGSGGASSRVQFWSQLAGSKAKAGTNLQNAFLQATPAVQLATSLYGSPDQLHQKLLTGFVGGVLPDLFIQHWDYSLVYGSGNRLRDMTQVLTAADVNPKFARYASLGGTAVTAPLYGTSRALTINADLVTKSGLDPDQPPQSWEELREWAQRLVRWNGEALQVAGLQIYANDLELFEAFTLLTQGAGGTILDADATDVAFDGDAGVAAAEFLRRLVVEDRVTVPGFGIGDSASGPFPSGRAAIAINGNYGINLAEAAKVQLVVAKMPKQQGGYTSLIDPFCFGVPTGTPAADAAVGFARFALQTDQQVAFATTSRNIPVNAAAATSAQLLKDKPLAAFVEAATFAPDSAPANPAFGRMTIAVSRALQRMFFDGDSAATAVSSAAQQARPFIREGARR